MEEPLAQARLRAVELRRALQSQQPSLAADASLQAGAAALRNLLDSLDRVIDELNAATPEAN